MPPVRLSLKASQMDSTSGQCLPRKTTWSPSAAVLLAILATGGCGASKQVQPLRTDGHRTIAEGYSLLYAIASQQKDLKKLLLMKVESDPVDEVISQIADYTGQLVSELEDMARRYPALTIETQFLPEVEAKTRESISAQAQDTLLAAKGKAFERELLLRQLSALEQEHHMAKVMVQLETADERRTFWTRTEKRLGELYRQVKDLLERQYFC